MGNLGCRDGADADIGRLILESVDTRDGNTATTIPDYEPEYESLAMSLITTTRCEGGCGRSLCRIAEPVGPAPGTWHP